MNRESRDRDLLPIYEGPERRQTCAPMVHADLDRIDSKLDAIVDRLQAGTLSLAISDERMKGVQDRLEAMRSKVDAIAEDNTKQEMELTKIQTRHSVLSALAGMLGLGGILKP